MPNLDSSHFLTDGKIVPGVGPIVHISSSPFGMCAYVRDGSLLL